MSDHQLRPSIGYHSASFGLRTLSNAQILNLARGENITCIRSIQTRCWSSYAVIRSQIHVRFSTVTKQSCCVFAIRKIQLQAEPCHLPANSVRSHLFSSELERAASDRFEKLTALIEERDSRAYLVAPNRTITAERPTELSCQYWPERADRRNASDESRFLQSKTLLVDPIPGQSQTLGVQSS